jgi:hypothetical protein
LIARGFRLASALAAKGWLRIPAITKCRDCMATLYLGWTFVLQRFLSLQRLPSN